LIASGDFDGKLIVWHGDTGESLIQVNQAHSNVIMSLDFSPDGAVLATGSLDKTTKLWNTKTWLVDGNPISCGSSVNCVRYSPSGELAIATDKDIKIWNPLITKTRWNFDKRECIAKLKVTGTLSLAWTLDGTRLLSGGYYYGSIQEWDTSTWQQIGDPWGHTSGIKALAVNSTGTLVASASDNRVRIWRRSDRETIAIFNHSDQVTRITFSTDGTHIFSGGKNKKISQWAVPEDASSLLQDPPQVGFHLF
jgi:WD40 repeat protein